MWGPPVRFLAPTHQERTRELAVRSEVLELVPHKDSTIVESLQVAALHGYRGIRTASFHSNGGTEIVPALILVREVAQRAGRISVKNTNDRYLQSTHTLPMF